MQPYSTIMIKLKRLFLTFLFAVSALGAIAQSTATVATSSSPYSRYGLGVIDPALLPQNLAMGGIATAINRISGYNNINPENPASYAIINYTTIDAGIYSNVNTLSQAGQENVTNATFRLSHIAFAIPVTGRSALSFGLLPYSEMGYNYRKTLPRGFGTSSPADTNAVNYVYNGSGGLSKAYLGYGFAIGKHLFLGGNVSYIFGNLQQFSSIQIPALYGTLNSNIEQANHIGGLNYDYGAQYSFDFGDIKQKHLILAYSASAKSAISSTTTYTVSQFTFDGSGNQNADADSLVNQKGAKSKVQLPQINHFGLSFQNDGKFLIGADYSMGNWSSLTINGINAGLQNSKTFNIGGQVTPDINALNNYFARTDYRLGFTYEDTYLNLNNTDIKKYAVTFGIGLPLPPNISSFYKINFSAELGQEGTIQNGLVRQKYVNIHLSFTVNDKWFTRFKFD